MPSKYKQSRTAKTRLRTGLSELSQKKRTNKTETYKPGKNRSK